MQNTAPNSKKCSKGAQRNRERPTIQEGKMGYDQYTVPDIEADEPTFAAFL